MLCRPGAALISSSFTRLENSISLKRPVLHSAIGQAAGCEWLRPAPVLRRKRTRARTVQARCRDKGCGPAPRPDLPRPQAQAHRHPRSEEHTSELQSLMRISYAVFCLKKKNNTNTQLQHNTKPQ